MKEKVVDSLESTSVLVERLLQFISTKRRNLFGRRHVSFRAP